MGRVKERVYCCIDLKSFYASVECIERGLDPFKNNLVVADPTRQSGTICLAISPAMKAIGVKNRCRVFEIPANVNYVMAKPRMRLYMNKSVEIYSVYRKYVSADDILVYSIDECFIDLTDYVKIYDKDPLDLANILRREVFKRTGICATVGVGTNLFLAKIALDITAKHAKDFMGYLDIDKFRETIWHHKPITDVWNIGRGIAKRLEKRGIYDLYGIAHYPEDLLYKEFGVNAELLIDHANGIEPCTIKDVKNYKSKSNSLSNSQILFSDYSYVDTVSVMKEMVEGLVLEIIENEMVTNSISLTVGYSDKSVGFTGGSKKLDGYTSSINKIMQEFEKYFEETTDKRYTVRRIGVGLNNLIKEEFSVFDLFVNAEKEKKEHELQKTVVGIKRKYGKNSLFKGISYDEKSTAKERNKMIGGHNGGE